MSKEKKKNNTKIPKKRDDKYQRKISLYGMEEKEGLKELLKSPPMGSKNNNKIGYHFILKECNAK